jgi:hypothetical protein
MLKYRKAAQARMQAQRPLFSTPEGGRIVADKMMLALWDYADGRTIDEIIQSFQSRADSQDGVRAGLGVRQAGLLHRGRRLKPDAHLRSKVRKYQLSLLA